MNAEQIEYHEFKTGEMATYAPSQVGHLMGCEDVADKFKEHYKEQGFVPGVSYRIDEANPPVETHNGQFQTVKFVIDGKVIEIDTNFFKPLKA